MCDLSSGNELLALTHIQSKCQHPQQVLVPFFSFRKIIIQALVTALGVFFQGGRNVLNERHCGSTSGRRNKSVVMNTVVMYSVLWELVKYRVAFSKCIIVYQGCRERRRQFKKKKGKCTAACDVFNKFIEQIFCEADQHLILKPPVPEPGGSWPSSGRRGLSSEPETAWHGST